MSVIAAIAMAAAACVVPPGWDQVAATNRRYVVFGELHGTEQSPAMIGGIACGLARQGKRVLVAVELDSRDNDGLQATWRGPHEGFALRLLGAMPNWKGRNDGVASRAMLAMLTDLHALKSRGSMIDAVAFNGARQPDQAARFKHLPGQGPHEAAQAENIRQAADAAVYDHVLVLVGGLHARKQPVERGGISWEPMVMRLAPPDGIVALDMVDAAGMVWGCRLKAGIAFTPGKPIGKDAMDCRAHPARGAEGVDGVQGIALGPIGQVEPDDDAYDGHFYVGQVTASPPADPVSAAGR